MAFSWQKEEQKDKISPMNFSWGSEKNDQGEKNEKVTIIDLHPLIPGFGDITIRNKTKTPEQIAAESKIEAYNLNSPIGIAKETVKGLANPFIAAYEGALKGYKSVEPAEKGVKEFITSKDASAKAGGKVWADAVTDLSTRWNEFTNAWGTEEKSGVEREAATARLAMGGVNVFFAPISGTMKMLSPVPGVGYVADKVEQLFASIGGGAGAFAGDILDDLPIAEDKKKDLKPIVEETAAFMAMIAAGKAGEASYIKVKNNVNTILTDLKSVDAQSVAGAIDRSPYGTNPSINIKVQPEPTKVPVTREGTPKPQKVNVRQAYDEPYIPDSELPVIDAGQGARTPTGMKTIQTEAPKSRPVKGDVTFEPIEQQNFSWNKPKAKEVSPREKYTPTEKQLELVPSAKPKGEVVTTKKKKSNNGDTFQSETSVKFKNEAERRGFNTTDVPVQERRTKITDWKNSDEFVGKNTERALNITKGNEAPPTGMMVEDIYKSLELKALKDGNVDLINELIPLRVGTEAGRGLQALSRETWSTNPVETARTIQNARAELIGKELVAKERAKVKEIEVPKQDAWDTFIKEITC